MPEAFQENNQSKCCNAEVKTAHGCDADFGHGNRQCNCEIVTSWNECTKCNKPCDIQPSKEEDHECEEDIYGYCYTCRTPMCEEEAPQKPDDSSQEEKLCEQDTFIPCYKCKTTQPPNNSNGLEKFIKRLHCILGECKAGQTQHEALNYPVPCLYDVYLERDKEWIKVEKEIQSLLTTAIDEERNSCAEFVDKWLMLNSNIEVDKILDLKEQILKPNSEETNG